MSERLEAIGRPGNAPKRDAEAEGQRARSAGSSGPRIDVPLQRIVDRLADDDLVVTAQPAEDPRPVTITAGRSIAEVWLGASAFPIDLLREESVTAVMDGHGIDFANAADRKAPGRQAMAMPASDLPQPQPSTIIGQAMGAQT